MGKYVDITMELPEDAIVKDGFAQMADIAIEISAKDFHMDVELNIETARKLVEVLNLEINYFDDNQEG